MKIYKNINKISIYKLIIIHIFIFINFSKKNNKISIIIPTYNREKLIGNSIKSVLNQTYKNIEIIVVDDCSTDNTKKEIDKIKDKRIKYIKLDENQGAPNARNIGIKLASGKFIAFQDSDDIFHYDKLKKQINNLIKNKSDFDFCKIFVNFNDTFKYIIPTNKTEEKINNSNIYDELLNNGNFISTQSILVKKKYVEKFLFDVNMPRLQDYDLILRMLPKCKVSYTNEVLVYLYLQNNSITLSKMKLEDAVLRLLNKNYNLNSNQKKNFTNYLKNLLKMIKK